MDEDFSALEISGVAQVGYIILYRHHTLSVVLKRYLQKHTTCYSRDCVHLEYTKVVYSYTQASGIPHMMAYAGRRHPKGVPSFSGLRVLKG